MIINGREYRIPELDFNMICDLEEVGVSILNLEDKPISSLRGFLAVVGKMPIERAGVEIQEHLINGGEIDTLVTEIIEAMVNSGFFQALLSPEETKELKQEMDQGEKTLKE